MEIYIYCLVLIGFLALGFISREGGGIRSEKMARYLYRKGKKLGQKSGRLQFFEESRIRREIALLYPFGRTQEEEEQFHVERIRLVLLILLAGAVLAAASYAAAGANLLLREGNILVREEIGGEDRSTELSAYLWTGQGENGKAQEENPEYQGTYKLEVRARKYSAAQMKEMADRAFEVLPEIILGENESLDHVQTSLELPEELEGTPFHIAWESSSYALIDADGTIGNLAMEEGDHREVLLTAILTYDNGTAAGLRFEKTYEVNVFPPAAEEPNRLEAEIKSALREADEKSVSESVLPLPQELKDQKVSWEEKPSNSGIAVLLFAVLLAFLGAAAMGSRLHEKVVFRERQLMLDYPGIISKFVLYLGAGLSMRSTVFKIGEEYEQLRKEGMKERYVYEEILFVCRELNSGVAETEAYARFGLRCRSRQYTKLSTLLAQNLRKGNQALLSVLQQEAQASFEERRNTARRLGEEAETKLLLPMITMLAITMLMIIIPAYFSFM